MIMQKTRIEWVNSVTWQCKIPFNILFKKYKMVIVFSHYMLTNYAVVNIFQQILNGLS